MVRFYYSRPSFHMSGRGRSWGTNTAAQFDPRGTNSAECPHGDIYILFWGGGGRGAMRYDNTNILCPV